MAISGNWGKNGRRGGAGGSPMSVIGIWRLPLMSLPFSPAAVVKRLHGHYRSPIHLNRSLPASKHPATLRDYSFTP